MPAITDDKLEIVKKMYYQKGFSAREIAKEFSVSIDAVYYFMRRNALMRRSLSEQNAILFYRKKPSFKLIKRKLSRKEEALKNLGIMLYWCEGSKWPGEQQVDFVNSDPEMIRIFLKFLREICGIKEKKLRVLLYCYSNQNVENLIEFWSNLTTISKLQFTKPYIRKDFNPNKIGKMPYGLIHIRYCDKKLLIIIREWIENLKQNWAGSLVGCEGGL